MTPQEAERVIAGELEPGERILWSGVPAHGIRLRGRDLLVIPFTVLWAGFAIFWEVGAVRSRAPLFVMLWGIPFVLIGLYLVIGRFFIDAAERGKTAYGLTDRRAILVSGLFARTRSSVPLRTLHEVTLTEARDGSGTILLGPAGPWGSAGWPWKGAAASPAFEMIADAKSVYTTLRAAQSTA